jgi:outer membrane protein OmpA-like peptidoglycan-associated protein
LNTAVLFDTDKAVLTKKAGRVLDEAVKVLKAQDGRVLRVVGHTDTTGTAEHNLDLSKRRAAAVRAGLEERLGSGWSFEVSGKGESEPKVKESGLSGSALEKARQANRRVEVTVVK